MNFNPQTTPTSNPGSATGYGPGMPHLTAEQRACDHPEFPLGKHTARQRWRKQIKGADRYFLTFAEDPDGRLSWKQYLLERAAWESGRNPRENAPTTNPDATTLLQIADEWVCSLSTRLQTPGRKRLCLDEYLAAKRVANLLRSIMGDASCPADWRPRDFAALRAKLAHGASPFLTYARIGAVRRMLKWANANGLIPPPNYGEEFRQVSVEERADAVAYREKKIGERKFEAAEVRALLEGIDEAVTRLPEAWANKARQSAKGTGFRRQLVSYHMLRAAMYIAANSGAYAADIAAIATIGDLDTEQRGIWTRRTKTRVPWQVAFWPETWKAIEDYRKVRPTPDPAALDAWRKAKASRSNIQEERAEIMQSEPLFVTFDGHPLQHAVVKFDEAGDVDKANRHSAIAKAFNKFALKLGVKEKNEKTRRGFGAFRHTFRTLAAGILGVDNPEDLHRHHDAINRIMAHKQPGEAAKYIKKLDWELIRGVTDRVREAYWPERVAKERAEKDRQERKAAEAQATKDKAESGSQGPQNLRLVGGY
jgi:integrase